MADVLIRAPLRTPGTLIRASSRSSTDRASDYGSEGWGFESLRLRPGQSPLAITRGGFLLTGLLTATVLRGLDLLGEDVRRLHELFVDHVGVDPERDGRVGMAEAGRDDMDRHSGQEECPRVDVAEIVEPGGWKRLGDGFALLCRAVIDAMRDDTVSGWIGSPQAVVKTWPLSLFSAPFHPSPAAMRSAFCRCRCPSGPSRRMIAWKWTTPRRWYSAILAKETLRIWPSSLTVRPQSRARTRRRRMVKRRHSSGARALNRTEPVWS